MAEIIVVQRMWQRRGTASEWSTKNPVMAAGEIGVELGATPAAPQKFKIGNGATPWADLAYGGGDGGGGSLDIVVEPSAFTADPSRHEGRGVYTRAGGDVTFAPGVAGHVFNIRATSGLSLIGSGVSLAPPADGTLSLSAGMAVTVVFVSTTVAEVIGQTLGSASTFPADVVTYDNSVSNLEAINVQDAIDEIAAASGASDMVVVLEETAAFTASPAAHAGKSRYIRAGGDVTFNNVEGYAPGHVFNIRASADIELVGLGVTLTPTHGGTLGLDARMAVTVIMTSPTTADVIGLTVQA